MHDPQSLRKVLFFAFSPLPPTQANSQTPQPTACHSPKLFDQQIRNNTFSFGCATLLFGYAMICNTRICSRKGPIKEGQLHIQ